jgi:hypothetical protein
MAHYKIDIINTITLNNKKNQQLRDDRRAKESKIQNELTDMLIFIALESLDVVYGGKSS